MELIQTKQNSYFGGKRKWRNAIMSDAKMMQQLKGFVLVEIHREESIFTTDVYACNKHKKASSFFEYKTAKTN